MVHPRTPFIPFVVALIMVWSGFGTARALEHHGERKDRTVPARFFSVIAAPGRQTGAQNPKVDDPLPDGKGKEVTKRLCSGCHAVAVFATQRHTPERWAAIVDNMVSKGLDASDEELETINSYLSTYLAAPKEGAPSAAIFEPSMR